MIVRALGADVHVVERGASDPGAPTAVLLHGFPVDHRIMLEPFEQVFEGRRHWRRLYLDLPGMGATPAPEWLGSTDGVFQVVRAAVEELVPGPYVVIGESYGGYLARGLAAATPDQVEGLGLLCPMIVAERSARDLPPSVALVRDDDMRHMAGSEFDDVAVVQTSETWRRTQTEVLPGLAAADPLATARVRADWTGTFPLEPHVFDRPTLFLTGRQDSDTGYRDAWRLLDSYPRATFAVLDRAGHNLQIEQPALFTALTSEWLDRVDEARAQRRVRTSSS